VNRDIAGTAPSPLNAAVTTAYRELRSIAHRLLAARRPAGSGNDSLGTTALVHEAYLKLAANERTEWRDEAHFRALAAVAMRQILVDRARARAMPKHGGGLSRVSLDREAIAIADEPDTLLAIDLALTRLAEVAPRLARLVELRFFGGLSDGEIATELGITARTVQRDWLKARMLLETELS
jgi:RNA polymerase sigma factor (TIGR02999 family)